ncbi:D-Ala-D-Ala carboxypeptidase family metallohydrolase [Roseivirga pacifica]|uniref:D-Ala-D-Ala carboxypeptidase family metallohydrolase n=1 Tax=Roseivirga pacifica TaxID=1267423 RepID=UPI003BA9EC39
MARHPIYRYFQLHEFDCPSKKGSGNKMKVSFLKKLDKARMFAEEMANGKVKFTINSGFRTPEHNRELYEKLIAEGKAEKVIASPHCYGEAADIKYTNSREAFVIMSSLIRAGFTRIGFGNGFIHVDSGYSGNMKMQQLMWNYYD